ncbi:porin [Roseovarius sp. EL26]|uniref:porin n=1 Tax=Roseovarius sp. EL26 TaxID=2126672 RepID=UPI0020B15B4F|nr:porin [Roseovarius sp. EL26]
MKKHLLSTSAIALGVVAAAPASAQDWDLDWGGYFSSHIAIVDVSGNGASGTDYDGIGFLNTGEIIFSPSVTLDNGLTFGVNVQMEAQNGGGGSDGIDESYMTISGDSFGQLIIGSENSAGYKSMVGAPGVTSMYINSPSISAFIPLSSVLPFSFRDAGVSSYTEVGGNNDVPRLTYFTPSFNGFQAGVSYARNNRGNATQGFDANGAVNNTRIGDVEDIFDLGMSYNQTFGTVDVSLGARWGTGSVKGGTSTTAAFFDTDPTSATVGTVVPAATSTTTSGDITTWGIGAQLGFGAVTVGGSYAENNNNDAGNTSSTGWSFGGTYDAAGPWAFELLTYQGEYKSSGTGGADEEYEAYRLGASRDLGPGVDWDIYYVYASGEDKGSSANDVDGNIIGTAINLSF